MQRLRAAKDGGHGLDAGAHDVVVGVLLGERPARGLAVCAQHAGLGVLGGKLLLEQVGPEAAGRPELGNLHVEVHSDAPEEGEARRKGVNVQAGLHAGPTILNPVGQSEGHFPGKLTEIIKIYGTRILLYVANFTNTAMVGRSRYNFKAVCLNQNPDPKNPNNYVGPDSEHFPVMQSVGTLELKNLKFNFFD